MPLLLALVFVSPWRVAQEGAPPPPAPAGAAAADAGGEGRPRLLADVGVAAAGTLAVVLVKPDIRRAVFRDARLSNVALNFLHPVRQVRLGTRRDRDPFWVNGVAHPGLFALEALHLKARGYGDGGAFLFTQVHSLVWEFAVEGSAFEPSGKDLAADAAGAAAAIWVLRPIAAGADRRFREGRGRRWDGLLRWLDPVGTARGGRRAVGVSPAACPGGFGLVVAVSF